MSIPTKISIEKAKQDKLFYFVANVTVYRKEDGRCLILKRHEREIAHPGKWAVIGGKLEWKDVPINDPSRVRINGDVVDVLDSVEELLVREAYEEAGVAISTELEYVNSMTFVRPDEVPVVLVKFASLYMGGDVVPEEGSFTEYAWVNADEVKTYDCILGVQEEIAKIIPLMKKKYG